jgi:hypothetical protein
MIAVNVEQVGKTVAVRDPAGHAAWLVTIFAAAGSVLFTAQLRTEAMSWLVAKNARSLCSDCRIFIRDPAGASREAFAL